MEALAARRAALQGEGQGVRASWRVNLGRGGVRVQERQGRGLGTGVAGQRRAHGDVAQGAAATGWGKWPRGTWRWRAPESTAADDYGAADHEPDPSDTSSRSSRGGHAPSATATTPPSPPQPLDRRAYFLKGHSPVFTHSADPMDAEDWLRAIERELDVAQCTDYERVLYGPHQLPGGAVEQWWESYRLAHNNPNTITWQEFSKRFRAHHVPAGVISLKKEEFLALTQGAMSVSEYRDKFLQLSRYCPEEVNTDPKKQYRFLKGLVDLLRYQLMNHTFPNC
ncbi:hypothetical protein U9M48_008545 [Paspalum notatum var. saurae]|uniref:Retrotransposon gag domain-containing protein n=1 Tax=Paspalum notatum var. saurae TaxID=547442 RepID=A0AAQ3SPC1_PASNO